ncbi:MULTISPECIES: 16S rRNA (guanine(966)-N(2))-methyltransferase RsmD [Thermocrispum]|jgi:16S rRNA (guanine966-N2)-methyltransferase|uniref:16S rRNA (Guanine(966)-N(2))-methyltransferase RsmD n=1 Tax=Thermocrispum agreste TaxID=37925 RepID=A0ABD6FCE6_9PSEU|nr:MULTISPECIES: 16S rRNA (guanine(966)-N(2))-methyltransferase RsmD [Thermocrispum]
MTRIVAGRAGGRRLRVPARGTRPTSERIRAALFNALEAAGEVAGARVLDLYAGSGALGLEALSRGAADAVFVESDRRAVEVLRANVRALGLGGSVRHGTVRQVLEAAAAEPFDLVVADPPYGTPDVELRAVLTALVSGGWLTAHALVVVERASRDGAVDWPPQYRPVRVKRYGDTELHWAELAAEGAGAP